MNTAYRYNRFYPDKPGNLAFAEAYNGLTKQEPTNWAWQANLACQFIFEALKRTGGKTDGTALAAEMQGLQVASPFAVADTITMRASDHTYHRLSSRLGADCAQAAFRRGLLRPGLE